jgi:Tol biopolymer transport system component
MLTDGGENAEAYWSFDGAALIFQSTRPPYACDQIFSLDPATGATRLVSTGTGRTTCAYWYPDGVRYLYASTHLGDAACPPPPDMSRGYVWALYPAYDIFVAAAGADSLIRLTGAPGYDAEATISPRGDRIVFTSTRDGDLDIYTMNLDGSDVRRLTTEPGYDGGPFFSPDGALIVYRAHHPQTAAELADYRALLAQDLIRPSRLDIWVMNADGSDKRRVTELNCASFAPFFHPAGRRIIFSTNHPNPRSREFDLWLVDMDGGNLEQVTFTPEFDGFPMWAPDGRRFVFCSNRHNGGPNETNVFVTEWRD